MLTHRIDTDTAQTKTRTAPQGHTKTDQLQVISSAQFNSLAHVVNDLHRLSLAVG
jgi:hypothetical protein